MGAGLDLDTAIARLMGWRQVAAGESERPGYWTQKPKGERNPGGWASPPPYSTTMLYAWKVVEKFRAEGWLVRVQENPDGFPFYLAMKEDYLPDERSRVDKRALCLVERIGPLAEGWSYRDCSARGYGETAALAICRAALEVAEIIASRPGAGTSSKGV